MRFFLLIIVSLFAISSYADVQLHTIDGKTTSLASLKGKWVFINYWASWCGPCLEEINELNDFYRNNKQQVALYAVNLDGLPAPKQRLLQKELKMHYPSLAEDPGPQLGFEYVRGVPATFILNPEGKLAEVMYGSQTSKSLINMVRKK